MNERIFRGKDENGKWIYGSLINNAFFKSATKEPCCYILDTTNMDYDCWEDIADVIDEVPDELKISSFFSRGNTQRLDRNKPAPTLVPGHSNFPIHPSEHRSITIREAATITGFPLDYKFYGSHTSRCIQIGNAVPIQLSYNIALSVKNFLISSLSSV
jgi:DNA (cytosine-5)-methyltransferase 1